MTHPDNDHFPNSAPVNPTTTVTSAHSPAGTTLKEGDRLGNRYVLQRQIGMGGMSVVWRAWDEALHRSVAVKVMHAPLTPGLGDRDQIRREARAAARIEHPDAMGVYDVGETITAGGRLTAYVVMRLLDGHSLADLLDDGPLGWRDALEIVYRVADVLATAHGRGIVHRDVTPENVMLTDDGAKLLDFGIAAEMGHRDDEVSGPMFGTPPYVAPERLQGAEATGATDIYALGVLMFQMLTGRYPYPELTWEELETAHRSGRPPVPTGVPGLPRRMAKLCRRCLTANPTDRPTAAEVAQELAQVLGRQQGRLGRYAVRTSAVATACVVLATGAILLTGPPLTTTPSQDQADTQASATASAPATGSPSKAPSPSASPSLKPTGSAKRGTAPVLTVSQATTAIYSLLDRGLSEKSVRSDVATDIRQQVDNYCANMASTQAERQKRLDGIRRAVQERIREQGAITAVFAGEVDNSLVTLGVAVESGITASPR